tara:strand:- start:276 stop:1109 length:834 start_codon:yes stop_codon:yes gene_type:complete
MEEKGKIDNAVFSKLWDKGALIHVRSGIWSMEARLVKDDIGITGDVPDFVTLGYKKLFDRRIRNEFSRIVSNARTALQRYGFNFLLVGSHYIPKEAAAELVPVLQKCREEFYEAVEDFMGQYEEKREEYLTAYASWRDRLEPHYPENDEVRAKFYFDVYSYTIMSTPTYIDFEGLVDSLNTDVYLDWATDTANDLRKEARGVADALSRAVSDGTLDGRRMRRVRTLVDRISSMDLAEDIRLQVAATRALEQPSTASFKSLKDAAADIDRTVMRQVIF